MTNIACYCACFRYTAGSVCYQGNDRR